MVLKKAKCDAFGKRNSTDSMENHPTGPRCMMRAGRRRNVRSPSATSTRSRFSHGDFHFWSRLGSIGDVANHCQKSHHRNQWWSR